MARAMLSRFDMRIVGLLVTSAALVAACGGTAPPNVDAGSSPVDAGTDSGTDGDASRVADAGACHGTANVIHLSQANGCASHAGIDAGCNVQPKDQCTTDAECGAGQACLCEAPIPAGQPCPGGVPLAAGNVCVPANCHVDSDCGPCGVCQAEYGCGTITGYYCQTPNDACYPDTSTYDSNGCHFASGHWASSAGPVACPG